MKIIRKAWNLTAGIIELTDSLRCKNGKLVGSDAFYFNDYLERFKFNVKFKPYKDLGHFDPLTGMYTGVLRGLQVNETDISMSPIVLNTLSPAIDPPADIGPSAGHSDLFTTSVPLSNEVKVHSSVMDIFLCLDADAGALAFFSLFIFWVLFKYVARVNDVTMRLYACLFKQNRLETHRTTHKWMATLFVMAIFWFMLHLTSFISTEMTVAVPARIIDSLHDLVVAYQKGKPKVHPVIMEGLNIDVMILESGKRSARQVYDIIQKNRPASVYPIEETSIMAILSAIYRKEAAWIMDTVFFKGSQFACCTAFTTSEAHKFRMSKEIIVQTSSYHAYSKGLPLELKAQLDDMNHRLSDYGLNQDQQDVRRTYNSDFYPIAPPAAKLCLETFDLQKLVEGDEVEPFGLEYVVFAFYLFCVGAILATVTFSVIEPVYFKIQGRDGRKKKNIKIRRAKHANWEQIKIVAIKLNTISE